MQIPVLTQLKSREEWLAFCRRERPYCYVREPQALVDLQTGFLILTQLDGEIRDGRQAVKYSIGSRHSVEPAWRFIQACHYDLGDMLTGLSQVDFDGNVRDNALFRAAGDVSVRKFFSKEASLIAPSTVGALSPLQTSPPHWQLLDICRLLANQQYQDLRAENAQIGAARNPHSLAAAILDQLVFTPQEWSAQASQARVMLTHRGHPIYSLIPDLQLTRCRRQPIR